MRGATLVRDEMFRVGQQGAQRQVLDHRRSPCHDLQIYYTSTESYCAFITSEQDFVESAGDDSQLGVRRVADL